jgi:hypothetical protein
VGGKEEAMKRNTMVAVVLVVLALAVAGGGYWWSHRVSFVYQGLAGRFPDRVQAFFEMKELGQWMPPSKDKGASPAATTSTRGTDPMLQVLQTVWAAPPVTAKDLPEILRTKPVAAGFWLEGNVLKGGALMPLAPGEREAVEKALKEKLGDSPVVEKVAGVDLHKLEAPHDSAKFKMDTALWGVSDQVVVMALGVDGAKAVLNPPDKPLSTNVAFLAVQRTFPEQAGASLYITGELMAQGVKLAEAAASANDEKPAETEGAKPSGEGKPAPNAGKADKVTPGEPQEKPAPSGDKDREVLKAALKVGLQKFMAMDSVDALAMWTSPPQGDEKGWKVQTWLAFKEPPKGIWHLASQGAGRTPQMAGRLPKRAQVYVWGAGRDPARFYQDVMDELAKDLPADQMSWVRAGIGAAEGKVGMSFANDLLPTLSDEWCVVKERPAEASGEGSKGAGHSKVAAFIMLRDSRRFEDLVSQKLATQLKLKPLELKGARGWKWGEEGEGISLIVSGGMAILTGDPAWALDTGGAPERSWKALSDYRQKACMLVMADPPKQASAQDVMVQVECQCGPSGLLMKGRFPGEAPGMFHKDKGDKIEEGKEVPKGSI